MENLYWPSAVGNAAMVVLGLFYLFGTGFLIPMLFGRRDEQDKLPNRYEAYRTSSTYRPVHAVRQPATKTVYFTVKMDK